MAYSKQVRDFQRRLERIPAAVREAVKPALVQSAEELADMQRRLAEASRDTGALIDSIAVTPPGGTTPAYSQPGGSRMAGDTEAIVTVGDHVVRYAHLVEYGTAKAPAQPFFWPAFRLLKKRLQNRIKRATGKAVREQARRP